MRTGTLAYSLLSRTTVKHSIQLNGESRHHMLPYTQHHTDRDKLRACGVGTWEPQAGSSHEWSWRPYQISHLVQEKYQPRRSCLEQLMEEGSKVLSRARHTLRSCAYSLVFLGALAASGGLTVRRHGPCRARQYAAWSPVMADLCIPQLP